MKYKVTLYKVNNDYTLSSFGEGYENYSSSSLEKTIKDIKRWITPYKKIKVNSKITAKAVQEGEQGYVLFKDETKHYADNNRFLFTIHLS